MTYHVNHYNDVTPSAYAKVALPYINLTTYSHLPPSNSRKQTHITSLIIHPKKKKKNHLKIMGEAVGGSAVAIDCESFASADSSSQEYHSFSGSTRSFGDSFRVLRSFNGGSFRVHSAADSPPSPSAASSADHHVIALAPPPKPPLPDAGQEVNPQDAWLPITESRDGGGFSAVFHLVCSGIGLQALLLPVAFATLGW